MTNAKVAIELYVDDKGTIRIREFADKSSTEFEKVEQAGSGAATKIKGAWAQVQAGWIGIIGGIIAMREAWDLANMAAKAQQERRSFAALAASYGTSSQSILASLKAVSAGTIDTMTLIRNAGTAMMMGIAPENVIKLMGIARATAKMTGQTTVKAFEDITLAVGRQSKMILDNLGIIVSVEKANENYAKSLGKTASQLTDVEKKQAFMAATMKAGGELMERLGHQTDTAADKLERWTAKMADYKMIIGDLLIRTMNFVDGTFQSIAAGALFVSGGIFKIIGSVGALTDALHISSGASAEWKMNAEAAFGAANELIVKADKAFRDMRSSNDVIIAGQEEFRRQVTETTKALEEQEKTRKSILAGHKKAADAQATAEKEMYKEAGLGAEKYFSAEASELVQKAARWKKAGADIYQVEEWLYNQLAGLSEDAWQKGETAAGQAMDSMLAMTNTLIDQYDQANNSILTQLDAVGVKVADLDGQQIGLTATFDNGAVIYGIDTLIAKFRQLQAVSSAPARSSGNSGSQKSDTFENTDSSKSASEVANDQDNYYADKNQVTVNINQQLSRSDVTNIITEQKRQEIRG